MEKVLFNSKIQLSIEDTEKILFQMKNSTCKILQNNKLIGVGFFIKIQLFNESYKFLLINDNIVNKNNIQNSEKITIFYRLKFMYDLKLDMSRRIL